MFSQSRRSTIRHIIPQFYVISVEEDLENSIEIWENNPVV